MYKASQFTKKIYKVGEVASLLGITTRTLSNYERDGKIKMLRSDGGHRLVEREELIQYLGSMGLILDDSVSAVDIVYVCGWTDSICNERLAEIITKVGNKKNLVILKDVGLSTDDKRSGIVTLVNMCLSGVVVKVFVLSKEDMALGGYNYLDLVFKYNNIDVIELGES